MARRNRSPEENAAQEQKSVNCCRQANISSMDDIQNLFKETIAEFMENGLECRAG